MLSSALCSRFMWRSISSFEAQAGHSPRVCGLPPQNEHRDWLANQSLKPTPLALSVRLSLDVFMVRVNRGVA